MEPIKDRKFELELQIEELEARIAPDSMGDQGGDGGETVLPLPTHGGHHH
jgi:hypothetical protein